MNRRQVIFLALATLLIMGGLGYFFTPMVRHVNIGLFLRGHFPFAWQLSIGALTGLIIAIIGWQIVLLPYLNTVKEFFINVIGGIGLNFPQIVFVSLCAGIGE